MIQLYEVTGQFCDLANFSKSSKAQPYFLYDTTTQYYYWIYDTNIAVIAQSIILLLKLHQVSYELTTHLSTAKLLNNNLIEEYPELFI